MDEQRAVPHSAEKPTIRLQRWSVVSKRVYSGCRKDRREINSCVGYVEVLRRSLRPNDGRDRRVLNATATTISSANELSGLEMPGILYPTRVFDLVVSNPRQTGGKDLCMTETRIGFEKDFDNHGSTYRPGFIRNEEIVIVSCPRQIRGERAQV